MTVKLNLTIDEKTAKCIKSYASKRKTSVSKIAQEQFEQVLKTEKPDTSFLDFINKYAGSIKGNTDYDKARDEYLKKKYGV
jgi:Family of unknown function (DUF6364)